MNSKIIKSIDMSIATKEKLKHESSIIENAAKLIFRSLKNGKKLIIFGNGGSAADAQHISAEFVGSYILKRKGLPAIALSTNTSTLTAIGNDFGYEEIFSRQLEAFSNKGDIVLAISTSGNSLNVVKAIKFAKKNNLKTISLTGKSGGKLALISDLTIKVPSSNTQNIQESHIMIGHILVDLVETKLNQAGIFK